MFLRGRKVAPHVVCGLIICCLSALGCGESDATDVVVPVSCEPSAEAPILAVSAGDGAPCHWTVAPGDQDQDTIQAALSAALTDQTVCLEAGIYQVTRQLRVARLGVTLRGAGETTVLDFNGSTLSPNGVALINDDTGVRDLLIRGASGAGVSGVARHNVHVNNVVVEGAGAVRFGIDFISGDGIVVEGNTVTGATRAAIRLSRGFRGRVANNDLSDSGAGLELEASTSIGVDANQIHGNTIGVLITNTPGLPGAVGSRAKLKDNVIDGNNGASIATAPGIDSVSGIGVLIVASDRNEVAGNTIRNNQSAGIAILSREGTILPASRVADFDAIVESSHVFDNTYEGNAGAPTGFAKDLGAADVVWDGCIPDGDVAADKRTCIREPAGTVLNLDVCGQGDTDVDCELTAFNTPEACSSKVGCPDIDPAQPEANETCEMPYPRLSDYGFFGRDALAAMVPTERVLPYEVSASLWADGAEKWRYLALPANGETIAFKDLGTWILPTGAVLIKSFGYPLDEREPNGARRLIETRLLIHTSGGWVGHSYVWNDAQTEAHRYPAGLETTLSFTDKTGAAVERPYLAPSPERCADCHGWSGRQVPLGLNTRMLNRMVSRDGQQTAQIQWLADAGAFAFPPQQTGRLAHPSPYDETADLNGRARAWLDTNCGHCHRPGSAAEETDLVLAAAATEDAQLGICQESVYAGGAGDDTVAYTIVPGDPDASLMVQRIAVAGSEFRMPPLPLQTLDSQGLELIRAWIADMPARDCAAEATP
ncbi:MAG: parallel beta-helix repeat protein [Myxococcota bacterium]|jgi:parallel beta-helix repeat protein